MFKFFKKQKIEVGQIWFFDPKFQTGMRGKQVTVLEVGTGGIKLEYSAGGTKIISKDDFLSMYKLFK